ncbi:protein MTL1-like [Stylophora pistillata]|uniref:protein MTL1-like n=1 Tax=Stylophora pistillata TaxID=50429 RepID=UPI000C049797|nr:protein MTL1-like [Stylophora pistillata]
MIMADCKMWGTLLLSITLLSDNTCRPNVTPCTRTCNTGSCSCNLKCSALTWFPTCSPETCNQECSIGICSLHFEEYQTVCNMHCYAVQCVQTCDTATCHMNRTWPISFQNKPQCSGNEQCCNSFVSLGNFYTDCGVGKSCTCIKFSKGQRNTSNAITSTTATATQVFAAQSSTVQGTKNSQAYTPLKTPSPPFLSPSPLSSLLLSSSTSSSSLPSSSSSLSSSSTAAPSPSSRLPSWSSSSLTKTSPSWTLQVIKNVANDSISKLNGIDIRRNSSLKEAVRVFEVFTDRLLNTTKSHRGRLSNREEEKIREFIFKVAISFEEFALDYGKYHLSQTKPSTKTTSQKMVMGIQRGYRQNATDFFLKEEKWQASVNISSEDFSENGSVVVGCMYKDLHELLVRNNSIRNETGNSK